MSIHPSLRGADTLGGERSVLTRFERIQKLAKEGKLDIEQGSAWGLPKVRTKFKVVGAKKPAGESDDEAASDEGQDDEGAEKSEE